MTTLVDTIVGFIAIALLAARTGFRTSGSRIHPYWRWRKDTAEGPEAQADRWEKLVEYARWIGRMRRLR
ncbi:MAG: hypothetical protein AAGI53_13335 [Planctomycetota bacterium]